MAEKRRRRRGEPGVEDAGRPLKHEDAMQLHAQRKLGSILTDNMIDAKKKYQTTYWADHMNECDYPGVDDSPPFARGGVLDRVPKATLKREIGVRREKLSIVTGKLARARAEKSIARLTRTKERLELTIGWLEQALNHGGGI